MPLQPNKPGLDEPAATLSATLQKAVDAVYNFRANEPLDQVRPALRTALKDIGMTVHGATLDTIAGHSAAGTRVDTTPPA
jgi:hypothetical protein